MSVDDERAAVWRAIGEQTDRVTELREDMREMITEAVREAMAQGMLTPQYRQWLDLAIEEKAQRVAFRREVIEKTTTALICAGIVAFGVVLKEFFTSHGWKQ